LFRGEAWADAAVWLWRDDHFRPMRRRLASGVARPGRRPITAQTEVPKASAAGEASFGPHQVDRLAGIVITASIFPRWRTISASAQLPKTPPSGQQGLAIARLGVFADRAVAALIAASRLRCRR
jgi:hypothetical protein